LDQNVMYLPILTSLWFVHDRSRVRILQYAMTYAFWKTPATPLGDHPSLNAHLMVSRNYFERTAG
jgi:hypothetical protein